MRLKLWLYIEASEEEHSPHGEYGDINEDEPLSLSYEMAVEDARQALRHIFAQAQWIPGGCPNTPDEVEELLDKWLKEMNT